jgi:hypothetical protein
LVEADFLSPFTLNECIGDYSVIENSIHLYDGAARAERSPYAKVGLSTEIIV